MVKPVFIKAQASSLIASATDFAVTVFLVEVIHLLAIVAAAIGTITGGVPLLEIVTEPVMRSAAEAV
ncbi:MAG TPA: hypothetical protein PLC18_11975, partial [Sediminibacterium sp.]|uniref:hypothetical protein n=1 Tax=Sediminibacterium sp. TaxID=1917865 RepID=UPI002BAF2493